MKRFLPLIVVACAQCGIAAAALPPVQATLDSRLIQRTLALPLARENVFLIDDTLRYLGLVQESDLFRRYVKRQHYATRITGEEPDRSVTAKQAIERERAASEESLLRLHEAYYRKNIEVVLLGEDETPYQAVHSTLFSRVAPALPLWGGERWELPKSYSPFYFGVRVSPRQALDDTDRPPPPEIRVVLDDGRSLDLKCRFSLIDLAREKTVRDWCGGRTREKLDREIVSMAQELAAGRGHLEVGFTQTKLDEDPLWLKNVQREGMDARAWQLISTSICFERSDCVKQAVRLASISMPLYLAAIGFLAGAVVASILRVGFALSTATVLKFVAGLCAAGAAIAFVVAMVANSLLGLVVLPIAACVGVGMLASSLLVCRMIGPRVAAGGE